MAAKGWRETSALDDALLECAFQFDFFQAVKLVGILAGPSVPVGEGSQPNREAVRFKSAVNFNFPASDLQEIRFNTDPSKPPMEMLINFIGLAGCLGPLPPPYTDLIAQRRRYKDTAVGDFLDIFNHRLASLMYRVRKNFRMGFDAAPPQETVFAAYFFAVMGLGGPFLRKRMDLQDKTLLPFASFFSQQRRSAAGLEQVLRAHFQAPVVCRQFRGRWFEIGQDSVTRIGWQKGQCQQLGQASVLGNRVWDQQSGFDVSIGPLAAEDFYSLLPTGKRYRLIRQVIRFYVGDHLDGDLFLYPRAEELPQIPLAAATGPRLGWTSYLKATDSSTPRRPVRLCARLLDEGSGA